MCGRYTLTASPASIASRFGGGPAKLFEGLTGRYNVAPGQPVAALVSHNGVAKLEPMTWGLVPSWADDPKIGYRMINARSETVLEKPAFRSLIRSAARRALLPADGFYEWLRSEDPKRPRQPFRFTVDGGAPFAFAGLWSDWTGPDGEVMVTCTILTAAANNVVRPVHDRMPVIFGSREHEVAWLDSAVKEREALELLRPFDSDRMAAAPASRLANAVANEGAQLLDPNNGPPGDEPPPQLAFEL